MRGFRLDLSGTFMYGLVMISEFLMPSCHVCGETMVGICPKCGTSTRATAAKSEGESVHELLVKLLKQWPYCERSLIERALALSGNE